MKNATWNIERLKHKRELTDIMRSCEETQADILVLTETDEQAYPDFPYRYQTPKLSDIQPDYYNPTENRVSIFTRYKAVRQLSTYDKYTALCVEMETELAFRKRVYEFQEKLSGLTFLDKSITRLIQGIPQKSLVLGLLANGRPMRSYYFALFSVL